MSPASPACARLLVLWRHGEAEPPRGSADRARELTPRGRAQAERAARQIASLEPRPTLLLHSSAPRAAQTAALGAAALALPAAAVRALDALYLASPATVLSLVDHHAEGHECVLVVGHNPGLSELGAHLDATHRGAALDTASWWRVARGP